MKSFILFALGLAGFFPGGAQNVSPAIDKIDAALASSAKNVNDVLTDTSLIYLHSETSFREMIKKYARSGPLSVTTTTEPGARITVSGVVTGLNGTPIGKALVYVYQTNSLGWYSDTAPHILMREGDRRHARLFGYFMTNGDGSFEVRTIKPQGYPASDLPAHIHFEVTTEDNRSRITELLFDDDPRLQGAIRERATREGFIISKNSGTSTNPVYKYVVALQP